MIAGLAGKLESLGPDYAIINVNGISFQVFMPTSTLSKMGAVGRETRLRTHLHVKEDGMVLYGFGTGEELRLFEKFITVSGIGPRLANSMLSAMNVENLTTAIASGNTELLTTVPGVGKKTASRIILELKDKIGAGWETVPVPITQENNDVLATLTTLGYSVAEASRAVAALPHDADISLEDKIKLALQYFGGK